MPPFTQLKSSMKRCIVPLGIACLARVLDWHSDIEVKILDCIVEGYDNEVKDGNEITYGLSDNDIAKVIKDFNPDCIAVSNLMSRQMHNAKRVCKIAKEINSNTHVIIGGYGPSASPNETLKDKNIDTVIIGEGENVIEQIVRNRTLGIIEGTLVKAIPEPARYLLSMEKYLKINMPTSVFSPHNRVTQVEFTRGCPFNCCFCATTKFKGKHRKRTVTDCCNEIRQLKMVYNIEELDIIDSNFIVDRTWTIELLKVLKRLGIAWANPGGMWVEGLDEELLILMKESGCYQISLAIESSTPHILKNVIHKPLNLNSVKPIVDICNKIGIDLHAFFVCGFPEQTKEEMFNDYRFAKKMNFTSASFNIISPLPGSSIYEKYKHNLDLSDIDLKKASIPHPDISRKELEVMANQFNHRFNRSLIYRKPVVFLKKYVGTIVRKFSWKIIKNIFSRQ